MPTVVLLANSHSSLGAGEIPEKSAGHPAHHVRTPKALLPATSSTHKCILDEWWALVKPATSDGPARAYLVSNAAYFKHFERWATASGFPTENIINDGTTDESESLGPAASLALVSRRTGVAEAVLAVAAECGINWVATTEIGRFLKETDGAQTDAATLVPLSDSTTSMPRVTLSKMTPSETGGASPALLLLQRGSLELVVRHEADLEGSRDAPRPTLGSLLAWLLGHVAVDGFMLSDKAVVDRLDEGERPLLTGYFRFRAMRANQDKTRYAADDFSAAANASFAAVAAANAAPAPLVCRAYARVGLMGNPSDGFFGRTISVSMANFWAEVRLWPSERLAILPHPLYDPTEFGSMAQLHAVVSHEGTNGGVRLLLAACKRFYEHAREHAIELRTDTNFTIAYDTNVPRQVGLAGSSAIITATVSALMAFHGVGDAQIPREALPSLVLSIEQAELGINAGLQDRVIQAYGGMVYMDFEREHMLASGRGVYERLPVELAPPLWLAYLADPSDSGKIHSTVRARYDEGDATVVAGMARFAELTTEARTAIQNADMQRLGELMSANFALRRDLYGDGALGAANLRMVEIAQRHGVPAKFPGSGGAVLGLCIDDAKAMTAMQHELERNGCVFVRVRPSPPLE